MSKDSIRAQLPGYQEHRKYSWQEFHSPGNYFPRIPYATIVSVYSSIWVSGTLGNIVPRTPDIISKNVRSPRLWSDELFDLMSSLVTLRIKNACSNSIASILFPSCCPSLLTPLWLQVCWQQGKSEVYRLWFHPSLPDVCILQTQAIWKSEFFPSIFMLLKKSVCKVHIIRSLLQSCEVPLVIFGTSIFGWDWESGVGACFGVTDSRKKNPLSCFLGWDGSGNSF